MCRAARHRAVRGDPLLLLLLLLLRLLLLWLLTLLLLLLLWLLLLLLLLLWLLLGTPVAAGCKEAELRRPITRRIDSRVKELHRLAMFIISIGHHHRLCWCQLEGHAL